MTRTPLGTPIVGRSRPSTMIRMPVLAELHLVTRVGGERFAFPVLRVEEAVDSPHLSWVPRAVDGLVGQLRHRGRTVSAFDSGWLFGVQRLPGATTALVLRDGEARVAIVVDDVEDLLLVEPESVRAVPAGADQEDILRGVCLAPDAGRSLVGLVHVDALLARALARAALPAATAG